MPDVVEQERLAHKRDPHALERVVSLADNERPRYAGIADVSARGSVPKSEARSEVVKRMRAPKARHSSSKALQHGNAGTKVRPRGVRE